MESIEQMIKRLCPKGVEYVKLGDLFVLRNGYTPSKGNVDFWTDGTIPWFRMEDIRANGRILNDSIQHITPSAIKGKGLFPAGSFILATTATIGEHALLTTDSLANQQFTNLSVRKTHQKDVNVKFLYHYMFIIDEWCKKNVNSSSFASVDMNKLKEYMIPIPPLEIQSRIVEVLDKMTTLTAELEAELKAELEARNQQYEYYRNKLLTFSEIGGDRQVAWKKISEICTNICSGGTPPRDKSDYFIGNIPWLRTQEVNWTEIYDTELKISEEAVKNSSAKIIPSNCVIVAMYGATAAKACINKIELTTNQACCNLQIDSGKALYKYVYYWICNNYIKLKCLGEGSQNNLNAKKIKDFIIPIPPLSKQQRIVSILDRFEALTTDLQSGLPAEIEARRQQYEYYRNKLLTFEAV